ncbi:hypothetical protein IWQ56_006580, partial [Coemansia nantahalensis]
RGVPLGHWLRDGEPGRADGAAGDRGEWGVAAAGAARDAQRHAGGGGAQLARRADGAARARAVPERDELHGRAVHGDAVRDPAGGEHDVPDPGGADGHVLDPRALQRAVRGRDPGAADPAQPGGAARVRRGDCATAGGLVPRPVGGPAQGVSELAQPGRRRARAQVCACGQRRRQEHKDARVQPRQDVPPAPDQYVRAGHVPLLHRRAHDARDRGRRHRHRAHGGRQ